MPPSPPSPSSSPAPKDAAGEEDEVKGHFRPRPPPARGEDDPEETTTAAAASASAGGKRAGDSLSGGGRIDGLPNATADGGSGGGGGRSNAFSPGPDVTVVEEATAAPDDLQRILRRMREMNEEQLVRNEDVFGPVANDTVVIAIQVKITEHLRIAKDRLNYFSNCAGPQPPPVPAAAHNEPLEGARHRADSPGL